MKKIIAALTASTAAALLASSPAAAQGVPVIDPGNIAQTVKVVQNGVQQIQQLKAQVEQLSNLKNTIGDIGKGAIGSILKSAGLDLASKPDALLGQYTNTIPGIIDALPSSDAGKELGIDPGVAQKAKGSIDDARRFAISAFYGGSNVGLNEANKRQAIREAAMRDSSTAGFATAVVTKTRLGESETTIKALNEQMGASTDLRTDIQNNTAVGMAQLQQQIIQTQLIAQLLEVQSTGNMANNNSIDQ